MTPFAEATWAALDQPDDSEPALFDRSTLASLPEPAQRLLVNALPDGTPLHDKVRLSMRGEIRLGGRWLPFTAEQILRAGTGFVWAPVVGRRLIRFVGADALGPDGARIEFRLRGRIPLVSGSGPDIARSANGRLAAETVAWLPHALTPQGGAAWTAIDNQTAAVTLDGPGGPTNINVTVDHDGVLRALGLQRWRDSAKPPALAPFGGTVGSLFTSRDDVLIARTGTVGWGWGTPDEASGAFFRYEITHVDFGSSAVIRGGHKERS